MSDTFVDALDVDLVINVLSRTLFSPFLTFFVPIIYLMQGASISSQQVVGSAIYFVIIVLLRLLRFSSAAWRNRANFSLWGSRLDWGSQNVLITGGSSGIGRLLAETLAARNVSVIVLDVNPFITDNDNIAFYKCDVSNWDELQRVSRTIIEEVGNPTILVNNAGIVHGKTLLDLTVQDVKDTFGVNILAHFWTLKAFLPSMIENSAGHVVTISSVLGYFGCAQLTDYNASKAAATSLHDSLRYELDVIHRAPAIRTTLVTPGHVLTSMFRNAQFPNSWWYKFLAPSVSPHDLVKAIIVSLDSQMSIEITMPFYTKFASLIRLLPSWMVDYLHAITKADLAMGVVK